MMRVFDHDRDCYLRPLTREWWWVVGWLYVLGPWYRLLMRLGVWEIEEGGFYVEGRFRWPWRGAG